MDRRVVFETRPQSVDADPLRWGLQKMAVTILKEPEPSMNPMPDCVTHNIMYTV